MARTRDQIGSEIMRLLALEEWTVDEKVEYEELIEEYPSEGPNDFLAIASWDEAADLLTGEI